MKTCSNLTVYYYDTTIGFSTAFCLLWFVNKSLDKELCQFLGQFLKSYFNNFTGWKLLYINMTFISNLYKNVTCWHYY